MSFIARTTLRSVRTTPVARFSTSVAARKGPVDAAKDTIKTVDRTVSNAAVKGIETGEKVAGAVKETAGIKGQQAKEGAKEAAHDTAQKAEGAAEAAQQKTK